MKKLLIYLFILYVCQNVNAQFVKDLFKYSTIYVGGNIGKPVQESTKEWYVTQDGQIQDITEVYPFDYTISIGIRKMARFDYEKKPNVFYDGSEDNVTWKANVGVVDGFEYVFQYITDYLHQQKFYKITIHKRIDLDYDIYKKGKLWQLAADHQQ